MIGPAREQPRDDFRCGGVAYAPVLRDAARRGVTSTGGARRSEITTAVEMLSRGVKKALARGDAGDAYLKLAVELGNAAPASCRWAKNAAKRARTVLDGEDAEDAPMVPKKRKRAAARAKPVKERSKRRR